jgi:thioester reductase-like protein
MSEEEYVNLSNQVGEIYHSAADVRHYADDEEAYLATNTQGTAHVLELAKVAKAAFYHMSTCSVSGDAWKDGVEPKAFTEKDYDIGQAWENNVYVKSKFLAEGLVMEAAQKGLQAKIFRLGRLVGRASDGVFQKNPESNVFYLLMKGFCEIGAIPETVTKMNVDLMPIDVSAEEVLVLIEGEDMIYHIMSHVPVTLEETVKALGEHIRVVTEDEFIQILKEKNQHMSQKLVAIVMNHWYAVKLGQDEINVTNTLTMKALRAKGYEPFIPDAKQILQGLPV